MPEYHGIDAPTQQQRDGWLRELGTPGAHQRIAGDLAMLRQVDVHPGDGGGFEGWLRVVAWNVERLRHPADTARVIAETGAQVALLSEVDSGMARTGNIDGTASLAQLLGMGWAYGVEFVELGLGDAAERAALGPAAVNARGLHGNAILTSGSLDALAVVRLDDGGRWFSADLDQPRIGGQMAMVGEIRLDGEPVTVASVHLESAADADHRAAQLRALLEALDAHAPRGPAVIGGDLNSFGATVNELADRDLVSRLRAAEPARFSWPVRHEPVFEVAAEHEFEWLDANVTAPTTRHRPDAHPHHIPLKIDWLLVRGLEARRPTVIPAIGSNGVALSDHDAVAVSVRLRHG